MTATTSTLPAFTPADERPPKPDVVRFIDVPPRMALAIDGTATPGSEEFRSCIGALYTLAWTLKFQLKPRDIAYKVPPLEGFYERVGGEGRPWTETDPTASWRWTLLIAVPAEVSEADLDEARASGARRHPEVPLDLVELQTIDEGRCVEALCHHRGFSVL